jgi:hypothetical protein
MITAFLGSTENPAELALQPIDASAQTAGIDEIVVSVAIEIGDRALEVFEFA